SSHGRRNRPEAHKLTGAADPLPSRKQNRTALDRKLAEPETASIPAPCVGHPRALPAPFIFRKAALQISACEQRHCGVEMCIAVCRIDGKRLLETGNGLFMTIKRLQRAAAIIPGAQMLRRRGQRIIKRVECIGVSAKLDERGASIVKSVRVPRCARKDGIEVAESLLVMTECRAGDAAVEKRIPVARIARQHCI